MSSILRQSSSTLARISRSSATARLRSSQPSHTLRASSSRLAAHQRRNEARWYSTPRKEDGKDSEGQVDKKASKSAPGTENLYEGQTPLSQKNASVEESSSSESTEQKEPELEEGFVRLSAEDQKSLDEVLETLKKGLPKSQVDHLERYIAEIKKYGVPAEMKEFLDETKGKPMTLASAARLTRLTTKMAWKQADAAVKRDTSSGENKTDFKSNDNKESSSSGAGFGGGSGKGSGKKGGKRQIPEGFKVTEIKLDASTLLLTAFTSYLLYKMVMPSDTGRDISYQEFRSTFFDKGLVEKLTVSLSKDGGRVRVDLNREATQAMYPDSPAANPNFHYYFSIGSVETFERRLDEAQEELGIPISERIPVSYASGSSGWELLVNFGPTLLFVAFIFFISRRAAGGGGGANGVFGMGKSRAKQFNHDTDVKVKFSDVAGMDEAKHEIMEFVSFLKTPEQFQRLGAKIPRGAILSGPPGTGKTLLAKATAGESGVPFFSVSGSEFVEMFVGVGASRVRDLFAMARKNTPCIIFIDEIDAIGKARGKGQFGGGNDEREATLNQILTEMDGFNTSEQVVVLAGTNRPDVLDKALMRPGRFDRHIGIDRPTMEGRRQIFKVHLGKIVTNEDIEFLTGRLSALTPGFSGADIANCVNEAALIGKFYKMVCVGV